MMAFVKLHLPYMMCMKIAIKWVILIGTWRWTNGLRGRLFSDKPGSFRNFVSNFISGSQPRDPLFFFPLFGGFSGSSGFAPFSDTAIWENRPYRDLLTPSTGLSIATLGEGETRLFPDIGGAPQHENINKLEYFGFPRHLHGNEVLWNSLIPQSHSFPFPFNKSTTDDLGSSWIWTWKWLSPKMFLY